MPHVRFAVTNQDSRGSTQSNNTFRINTWCMYTRGCNANRFHYTITFSHPIKYSTLSIRSLASIYDVTIRYNKSFSRLCKYGGSPSVKKKMKRESSSLIYSQKQHVSDRKSMFRVSISHTAPVSRSCRGNSWILIPKRGKNSLRRAGVRCGNDFAGNRKSEKRIKCGESRGYPFWDAF